MKMNTYLNYGGNCGEAFRFYEKELGGKINMLMTHGQSPVSGAPPEMKDAVLHASITIAGTVIMASDIPSARFQPMRSVYLCLALDSDAEAERIYALLSNGGEVFMPMQETFFATRFGQLRDRFGTSWMIIHEKPMGPPPQA
jgi:PhnB protein